MKVTQVLRMLMDDGRVLVATRGILKQAELKK